MQELGLAKAQHTRIGDAFVRGISGGERKRVAFGQALLGNPSLVFADEPTSGPTTPLHTMLLFIPCFGRIVALFLTERLHTQSEPKK